MCEKCAKLDKRIAYLRVLAARLMDPPTVEIVNKRIEETQAQKAAFQCEPQS
jgi:16S rRNA G527 N7-methylase RsmG